MTNQIKKSLKLLVVLLVGTFFIIGSAEEGLNVPNKDTKSGVSKSIIYDNFGRVIRENFINGHIEYTYDNNGNLIVQNVVRGN